MKKQKKEKVNIFDNINNQNMSEKEMESLLVEMKDTIYYQAIKKYILRQKSILLQAVMSINAVKEPERISIYQGEFIGIDQLSRDIEKWSESRNKKQSENEEEVVV